MDAEMKSTRAGVRTPEIQRLLDQALDDQESSWERGDRMPVEAFLRREPMLRIDEEAVLDLIYHEYTLRQRIGGHPDANEFMARFPELVKPIMIQFGLDAAIPPSTGGDKATEATDDGDCPLSRSIGGYEILAELGRGGMGIVYKCRDVELDRVVAVKTIAGGRHATAEQRARFDSEARAVARLKHPHIIAIHLVGHHDRLPYLALEFAEGGSLSERMGHGPMPPRAAAELIGTVARAVHTAHEAGVVHRDLKPSNILFGADGAAKVSDFGLAKLVGSDSRNTLSGQPLGTPNYMSPEQARAESGLVGPQSDIYALGAVLYETLTGRPPFLGGSALETLKLVVSAEVVAPRMLRPDVPRDLETICLKCLEKEPGGRYETAEALADDLGRFLADRPIAARRASRPERVVRWCRRNPRATAMIVLLLATTTVAVISAIAARQSARAARLAEGETRKALLRAETEAATARAINEFFNKDLLGQASAENQATPETGADPNITVRTVLDRAAGRIGGKFPAEPLVEAFSRRSIGETYKQIGLYPEAQPHLERALELYRTALAEEDPATLGSMADLSLLYLAQGKHELAERLLVRVYDTYRRVNGAESPDTLAAAHSLGDVYFAWGRPKDAETRFSESLNGFRKALGSGSSKTLTAAGSLGALYQSQGRLAEAEPLLRETAHGLSALLGLLHPDTLTAKHNLGELYFYRDNLHEAERVFDEVLEARIRTLRADHPSTLTIKSDIGVLYGRLGRLDKQEKILLDLLAARQRVLGPDHPDTFGTMSSLGVCYHNQKKSRQSIEMFEKALAGSTRAFGKKNEGTLWIMLNLGSAYIDARPSDAEDLLRQATDGLIEVLGPTHQETLHAMSQLAYLYGVLGKPPRMAEPLLTTVFDDCRNRLGPEHPDTLFRKQSLAACYVRLGRLTDAEAMLRELVDSRRRRNADHEEAHKLLAIHTLAQCYAAAAKYNLAKPLLVEAIDGRKRVLGRKAPETLETMDELGAVLSLSDEFVEAERILRECLEIRKGTMPDHWSRFNTESLLGGCLLGRKRFGEAEPTLLAAFDGLRARAKNMPAIHKDRLPNAARRVVTLYDHWGKKTKAAEWRTKIEDLVFPGDPFVRP
jgi:eukaryotic-like serine/threonine-protein kinase